MSGFMYVPLPEPITKDTRDPRGSDLFYSAVRPILRDVRKAITRYGRSLERQLLNISVHDLG